MNAGDRERKRAALVEPIECFSDSEQRDTSDEDGSSSSSGDSQRSETPIKQERHSPPPERIRHNNYSGRYAENVAWRRSLVSEEELEWLELEREKNRAAQNTYRPDVFDHMYGFAEGRMEDGRPTTSTRLHEQPEASARTRRLLAPYTPIATGAGERGGWQARPREGPNTSNQRTCARFPNDSAWGQTGVSTQWQTPKMFKVEEFPKGLKPADQHQEWVLWLANFELAMESRKHLSERGKAVDMSLHIGSDIRRIITVKGMLPPEESVPADYPFYKLLKRRVGSYFESLGDKTVDVNNFLSMKQKETETVVEFDIRLQMLAQRTNNNNPHVVRARLIEGLRDEELKIKAKVEAMPHDQIVQMASRKEAMIKEAVQFKPWGSEEKPPISVAAVERDDSRRFERSRARSRHPREGPERRHESVEHDQRNRNSGNTFRRRAEGGRAPLAYREPREGECGKCGRMKHWESGCPAKEGKCRKCQKVGHFERKCPQVVRAIGMGQEERDEVGERDYSA